VQIAKALGARVTAVTNASNLETLRGVGADAVIDYAQDDFTRSGERYDVIFDVGANRPLLECKRVLTENGSIVIAGAPPGLASIVARMMSTQALARLGRVRAASFMARIRHDDLLSLKDLAESGKLTPVIDREGLLCDVPEAIAYVGSRRARGKVVIRVR
jgi:NADPH:quinone reductase-like Zn-dependent oxidoreductase